MKSWNVVNNKKGFTLAELIITLAVAGIVMTSVMAFFISNLKKFNMADEQVTLQKEIEKAVDVLSETFIKASKIERSQISTQKATYDVINSSGIIEQRITKETTLDGKVKLTIQKDPNAAATNPEREIGVFKDVKIIATKKDTSQSETEFSNSDPNIDANNPVKQVDIEIIGEKNGYRVPINTQVYLRNAQ